MGGTFPEVMSQRILWTLETRRLDLLAAKAYLQGVSAALRHKLQGSLDVIVLGVVALEAESSLTLTLHSQIQKLSLPRDRAFSSLVLLPIVCLSFTIDTIPAKFALFAAASPEVHHEYRQTSSSCKRPWRVVASSYRKEYHVLSRPCRRFAGEVPSSGLAISRPI